MRPELHVAAMPAVAELLSSAQKSIESQKQAARLIQSICEVDGETFVVRFDFGLLLRPVSLRDVDGGEVIPPSPCVIFPRHQFPPEHTSAWTHHGIPNKLAALLRGAPANVRDVARGLRLLSRSVAGFAGLITHLVLASGAVDALIRVVDAERDPRDSADVARTKSAWALGEVRVVSLSFSY